MPEHLAFDLDFGRPGGHSRNDDDPLRILVLGDFSGKPAADRPRLANRQTMRVDIDTLDDVMSRVGPKLQTPDGGISFHRIADFHPDHLVGTDLFQRLRHSRANPPAGSDDIGRLLGKPATASGAPAAAPVTGIDALIHHIVAPHVVKEVPAETRGHLAAVDAAMTEQMRALLHAAEFQSLESAWRGVHWLIANVELDGPLSLHLFDVTREEILADLVAAEGKVARSGVHEALVDRWRSESEGRGRSLLVGLFDFGASDADIGLLAAAGLIASRVGGPFLAGADPALASGEKAALSSWHALRRSEAAPWIGLAAPRVLLRMPYGAQTDPIESFAFEEFVGSPVHDDFLWGPGSLATALLIAQAFNARGWAMEPGDLREIGDLPAYTFVRDGERVMQPCAERFLTESQSDAMVKAGLMPIVSRRDRNAVVVIRFQSVADPAAPLSL
jgi:type VI secretion system protein ImpC